MPDDRLFHKRLGQSEKVNRLKDFEALVWFQYVLSADDFGVMRFSAVTLQADCDRLANRAVKTVARALERVREVGLIATFSHQGRTYCFQADWQDYQKIDYPRATINPAPPLGELSLKTRELLAKHPGGWGKKKPPIFDERSTNVPQTFDERSGEITPEPLAVSRKPLAVSREPVEKPARLAYAGKVLEVPKFLDAEFVKRLNGTFFDLTAFYLALDTRLAQTGEPWDLKWIRSAFDAESPSPSSPVASVSRRTRALAQATADFLSERES